ncbi:MAG: DUF222 domain-containing protein [bacterium]|nr:DUF222 domain-containing protein [bacterium]
MTDLTLFTAGTAPPACGDSAEGADGATSGAALRAGSTAVTGAGAGAASGADPAAATRTGGRDGARPAGEANQASDAGAGAPADSGAAARAVGLLDALVAALRSLGGDRLEERLGLVGTCEARLASVRSQTVAELARRDGEARAAEAVREKLRQSRGAAKRDVKLAGRLSDMAETAEALADGSITPQHARMIAEAAEHAPVEEAELLAAAAGEPADTFARTLRRHVDERTAGEDPAEVRRRQRARREVSLSRQPDGTYKLFGLFDPLAGARIETALAAEARRLRRSEDPKDRATPAQRAADALERLVTRSGPGKTQSTTLLVIADYDMVAGRLAGARLVDGTPLSTDELVRLAIDAKILPALFDTAGQPLWLGREQRDASAAQRIALTARDRGCVGCGAANSYCQPHHIEFWENGGPTDIDNLCLLCNHCHHIEIHEHGGDIARGPDSKLALHRRRPDPAPTKRAPRRRSTHAANGASQVNQPLRR